MRGINLHLLQNKAVFEAKNLKKIDYNLSLEHVLADRAGVLLPRPAARAAVVPRSLALGTKHLRAVVARDLRRAFSVHLHVARQIGLARKFLVAFITCVRFMNRVGFLMSFAR